MVMEDSTKEAADQGESTEPRKGGYDVLARGMATCSSFAVFRRFEALSIETLLYLQADLVRLERRLQQVQQDDRNSAQGRRQKYSYKWSSILDSRQRKEQDPDCGEDTRQLMTILEIRRRLKEYRKLQNVKDSSQSDRALSLTSRLSVLIFCRGCSAPLQTDYAIPTSTPESSARSKGLDVQEGQGKHWPLGT
jgi:hypothetical protein